VRLRGLIGRVGGIEFGCICFRALDIGVMLGVTNRPRSLSGTENKLNAQQDGELTD
jgi:hypothetical protein